MKLSFLFFGNTPDEKWRLCRQMGISYAIAKLSPELTGQLAPWDFESLKSSKEVFQRNGFELIGLEGDQFNMDRIKFGRIGRDEDIANYCQMLENMGRLGMDLLCYNFMAGIGWYRNQLTIKERGGALVSGFSLKEEPIGEIGPFELLSETELWNNYRYFLERVLPVAERWGVKLALHPDDPPVSPLKGIARIFTNADSIRTALKLSSSESHGLTFCQGTYKTMGEDLAALIDEFGKDKRIFFVHIRDVVGDREDFRETFHDNGPTDMVKMFTAYRNAGFAGPIRSDHVPTMDGESNEQHGYAMKGNLFGIGYMRGIMDALDIQF